HFGTHAVGPEAIDLAIFERSRRGEPKVDALTGRARNRSDLHAVTLEIKSGLDEEPAKSHVDPGRRSDIAALHDLEVPSPGVQVLMHDKNPVHALGLRAEQLDALPLQESSERRMSGSADEVDRARAQRRVGLVDRKNQLELDVEPFLFEESKLDGGDGREI